MISIILRFLAMPERAWPRLSANLAQKEQLPAPWTYPCVVGGIAGVCTFLGGLLTPSQSFLQALGHGIIAWIGYSLAPSIASWRLSKSPLAPALPEQYQEYFIAAAALPVIGSGIFNLIPIPGFFFLWTIAGAVLVSWSAYLGSSSLLGLAGPARKRVATQLGTMSAIPPLTANVLRISILG